MAAMITLVLLGAAFMLSKVHPSILGDVVEEWHTILTSSWTFVLKTIYYFAVGILSIPNTIIKIFRGG